MPAILRTDIGTVLSVTTANAIANNAYAAAADKLTIDNATNKALLVDFELVAAFAAAPVAGALQLFAVDYKLDGTSAGPAPSSSMMPRLVGRFDPSPQTGNALTSWTMRLSAVALTAKTDFYLYNNATGQTVSVGAVLKAQCWSPGS